MSIRENIQFFHRFDPDEYLRILIDEHGAEPHPNQDDAFLVEGLPFYAPKQTEEHIFVIGFNLVPLSHMLIQALVSHPDLAPDTTLIRWTQEQELIVESTLADLQNQSGDE